MIVNNNYLNNIGRINNGQSLRKNLAEEKTGAVNDFGAILKDKINEKEGLKFSKHAEQGYSPEISNSLKFKRQK